MNAAQPRKFVADDRNSLLGLTGFLDADILSELVDEDPTYCLMKQAILSKDYDAFSRIDPCIKSFWNAAAIVDGCIIIDDRIALPSCLQKADLSRLHRCHPGHKAMIDAEQYICWPKKRNIIRMCTECKECTLFDSRNLERDVLTAEQKGKTVIADIE